ncbi:response regulator [uncultured Massilia sp.]|uniref:response regulator n=1 Tax=uncultured Massilia sp. TaxID=169973 RepID=UPI0025FB29F0|nr:response regulator [uncultured Massilia sp.]
MHDSGKPAPSSSAYDWSASRLGTPGQWSPTLRLAADLMFNNPGPQLLVWGRDMTVLFNEAYAALAGPVYGRVPGGGVPAVMPPPLAAAPDALQRAWSGDAVLAPGCTPGFGGDAQAYDLHFTPLRDADGAVAGVLCALAPAAAMASGLPEAGAGPMRILVVEDNLDSQYLVCEMLRAFGHEADGVGHPNDALARLAAQRYDVLFTDVSLPGMSGVDLARKAVADAPTIQVIFASGYGDTLLRHVEFPYLSLQKPYELDQLQDALDKVARQVPGRA